MSEAGPGGGERSGNSYSHTQTLLCGGSACTGYRRFRSSSAICSRVAGGFSLWYVPENGAPEKLGTSYRDGFLQARVSHFSDYVIAYDETDAAGYADCGKGAACPLSAYSDLDPTAWYHDGV